MTNALAIETRDLHITHGRTTAVTALDMQVYGGEVLGLIGPDGAGKTSSLRVMAGLSAPTRGGCTVLGRDAWKHRRGLHHELGYLAQRFALYGDLSVDENVRFFATLYGVRNWRKKRDDLLERVGMTSFRGRLAARLSGGMKQKLALVCTLIHEPRILLLDEPTTGVDPVTRREFWRLLSDLVREGLTLVVATPYLDEAERCTRVILMRRGRVLADGRPGDLASAVPGTLLRIRATPLDRAARELRQLREILDVQVFASALHVRVEHWNEALARRMRAALTTEDLRCQDINPIQPRLEDAFLYLTQHISEQEARP